MKISKAELRQIIKEEAELLKKRMQLEAEKAKIEKQLAEIYNHTDEDAEIEEGIFGDISKKVQKAFSGMDKVGKIIEKNIGLYLKQFKPGAFKDGEGNVVNTKDITAQDLQSAFQIAKAAEWHENSMKFPTDQVKRAYLYLKNAGQYSASATSQGSHNFGGGA